MASSEQLRRLKRGVDSWNRWRERFPDARIDLDGAELRSVDLRGANLSSASLRHARLLDANLDDADVRRSNLLFADLRDASARNTNLSRCNLRATLFQRGRLQGADLSESDLAQSVLLGADLRQAVLRDALLYYANLNDANLENADLRGARIFGVSAWRVRLSGANQSNLVITGSKGPTVTVDHLEVAQFIYLLLSNAKIRDVIDTVTSKVVLILGRFTPERKAVLDALKAEFQKHDYTPVLFDFDKPSSRDLTETVSTLAHMARFVVADLTDAKSIPQELGRIAPFLLSVPIQPLILASEKEYALFADIGRYPQVLEPFSYEDADSLVAALDTRVIGPAEARRAQMRP